MRVVRLLRLRDFRLLVISNGLSSLGDELALIALTIKVFEVSHGSGIAVCCGPARRGHPPGRLRTAAGLIVDRTETTGTLAIASAIQAGIAVGLAYADPVWLIVLLCFLLGLRRLGGVPRRVRDRPERRRRSGPHRSQRQHGDRALHRHGPRAHHRGGLVRDRSRAALLVDAHHVPGDHGRQPPRSRASAPGARSRRAAAQRARPAKGSRSSPRSRPADRRSRDRVRGVLRPSTTSPRCSSPAIRRSWTPATGDMAALAAAGWSGW